MLLGLAQNAFGMEDLNITKVHMLMDE